jgi:hypothetical protein
LTYKKLSWMLRFFIKALRAFEISSFMKWARRVAGILEMACSRVVVGRWLAATLPVGCMLLVQLLNLFNKSAVCIDWCRGREHPVSKKS